VHATIPELQTSTGPEMKLRMHPPSLGCLLIVFLGSINGQLTT
jgi:hypothetical protein